MKLTEKLKQFLSIDLIRRQIKKILVVAIMIPLFSIASQGIVTADRTESTLNIKANQSASQIAGEKIQVKKATRRHVIRTAVYNQYASVTYYRR